MTDMCQYSHGIYRENRVAPESLCRSLLGVLRGISVITAMRDVLRNHAGFLKMCSMTIAANRRVAEFVFLPSYVDMVLSHI